MYVYVCMYVCTYNLYRERWVCIYIYNYSGEKKHVVLHVWFPFPACVWVQHPLQAPPEQAEITKRERNRNPRVVSGILALHFGKRREE